MSSANLRTLLAATLLTTSLAFIPAVADTRDSVADPKNTTSDANQANIDQQTVTRELAVFRAATVTLKEATLTVQRYHDGSVVADVSFDDLGGKPVYRVKTFKERTIWETTVDGLTGSIEDGETATSIADLSRQDRRILANVKEARASLPDAISTAERAAGGAAISAGSATSEGRLSYVIVVSNGEDLKQFMLDPPLRPLPVNCRNAALPARRHFSC